MGIRLHQEHIPNSTRAFWEIILEKKRDAIATKIVPMRRIDPLASSALSGPAVIALPRAQSMCTEKKQDTKYRCRFRRLIYTGHLRTVSVLATLLFLVPAHAPTAQSLTFFVHRARTALGSSPAKGDNMPSAQGQKRGGGNNQGEKGVVCVRCCVTIADCDAPPRIAPSSLSAVGTQIIDGAGHDGARPGGGHVGGTRRGGRWRFFRGRLGHVARRAAPVRRLANVFCLGRSVRDGGTLARRGGTGAGRFCRSRRRRTCPRGYGRCMSALSTIAQMPPRNRAPPLLLPRSVGVYLAKRQNVP